MPTYPIIALEDGDTLSPEWVQDITDAANEQNDRLTAVESAGIGQIVKRGSRSTTSTTTTTEIGVMRLDGLVLENGRIYEIIAPTLHLDSSSSNDEIFAQLRHTTNNTSAGTGSTVLPGSRVNFRQADANVTEPKTIYTTLTAGSGQTLSVLLTVGRVAGAGNCSLIADGAGALTQILIKMAGDDPSDTGIDI
jgi:hypothetical protein